MHDKQDESLAVLIEEFLTARATRKPSPHTLAAYRRDLRTIAALVAEDATPPLSLDALSITDLSPRVLRAAFARFAAPRAPASVHRAWSTWNSFFTFLVADGFVAGNPMPAVGSRGRAPPPKPLRGEDTPEVLLASAGGTTGGNAIRGRSGTWRCWRWRSVPGCVCRSCWRCASARSAVGPVSGGSRWRARVGGLGWCRSRRIWTGAAGLPGQSACGASVRGRYARTRRCWWIGGVSRCGEVACSIWWSPVTGGPDQ